MNDELKEIRKSLDEIDHTIIDNLARRQTLVRQISELKINQTASIRDEDREEQLLERVVKLAREAGLDRYFAEQIFRDIIEHSVRFQRHSMVDRENTSQAEDAVRVSYQGTDGAFSLQAAYRHFEERYTTVECIGYDTFEQAARAVEEAEVDYAILPIENTTAGSINQTYDILGDGKLHIVGEEAIRIIHCLLAIEQVPTDRIKRIISHPQALAQCSHFLSGLYGCKVESYLDTAMAARKVVEDEDLSQAAIAGSYAAQLYGLEILKRDIANQPENFTRFVIVSRNEVSVALQIPCKTSLLMTTAHDKGSLISCLKVLEDHGINMAKLESRPKPNQPWKYLFYLDIEANIANRDTELALSELRSQADSLKVLGCYSAQVGHGD
jgi:chorismate mutase/prephenate dehydratase